MSLFIKGVDMPFSCVVCDYKEMMGDCLICKPLKRAFPKRLKSRYPDCPMIEVLAPHGDLIDRNEILEDSNYLSLERLSDAADVDQMITECPTIIEAED